MENQKYIEEIKKKFPLSSIKKQLDNLKNLKVLLIGEAIIDEYIFTLSKGRATKDPMLSLHFIRSERYAGGILAIANHIAGFADTLSLVTILGDYKREEEFIKDNLNTNIKTKFFTKKDSPTINKTRYIDHIRNGKLFKVEYINDKPIDKETENEVIDYLREELPKYDLIVVGDFGHGFINRNIINHIVTYSKFLAANIQTNSSNMGFNYVTKYNKVDYLTNNEDEIRLALADRFGSLQDLIRKLKDQTKFKNILLTRGSAGCTYIQNNNYCSSPGLTGNIKDVVGAGDAVFAITSLLDYNNVDRELLAFIANCVGALAVNIMGNKESIKKENLIKFIEELK